MVKFSKKLQSGTPLLFCARVFSLEAEKRRRLLDYVPDFPLILLCQVCISQNKMFLSRKFSSIHSKTSEYPEVTQSKHIYLFKRRNKILREVLDSLSNEFKSTSTAFGTKIEIWHCQECDSRL